MRKSGYDLHNDPGEQRNLLHDPAHAPIAAEMEERMYAMMEELGGMEIPLNEPAGRSQNLRLRSRGGQEAADFPDTMVVDQPPNAGAK